MHTIFKHITFKKFNLKNNFYKLTIFFILSFFIVNIDTIHAELEMEVTTASQTTSKAIENNADNVETTSISVENTSSENETTNKIQDNVQDSPEDNNDSAPIKVLFIGNSLTYTNDIPGMVQGLCDAENSDQSYEISSVTASGYKLSQFASPDDSYNSTIINLLKDSHWDYVILQENRHVIVQTPDRTSKAIDQLLPYINASGASLIIYEPEVDYGNKIYVINSTYTELSNAEALLVQAQHYSYISTFYNCPLAMSGVNFLRCMNLYPEINLYKDIIHPSVSGSYLAACTIYKALTGKTALGSNYFPGSNYSTSGLLASLDAVTALKMQELADSCLVIDKTSITLNRGESTEISASISYSEGNSLMSQFNNTVEFYSMDSSKVVANRYSGRITALSTGETSILATSDSGLMAFCQITVKQPAKSVVFKNWPKSSLKVGETYSLNVEMEPADTTDSLAWTSSDKRIVRVDENGIITAKRAGVATITATSDSGISVSKKIYVKIKTPIKLKASVSKYKYKNKNKKKYRNITLSWNARNSAVSYSIFRSESPNYRYVKIGSCTDSNYVDSKVEAGKTYYYKVRAIYSNYRCNSDKSNYLKVVAD